MPDAARNVCTDRVNPIIISLTFYSSIKINHEKITLISDPVKTLLIILFPLFVHGQKTNEPDIVYPLLEQFISEAYNRDIPVYHKIKQIDSIQTALLKYPISGVHLRQGETHRILIHKNRSGRELEKTFYHEVGHVFGLKHSDNERDIMFSGSFSEWLNKEKNWQSAKDEYFKKLKLWN